MTSLSITHYSDILCVWAFIGQVRVAELEADFPEAVSFEFRYFNVFGDVRTKLETQWASRGGLPAYADHVHEVADGFEHVTLHADVWRRNVPASSLPAHLLLAAARCMDAEDDGKAARLLDKALRQAFFTTGLDIARLDQLLAIAEELNLPIDKLERPLHDGRAHALVADDLKCATDAGIRSSPTLTFNEGRQTLSGNVGYRVLEANVRELLRHPTSQQSWC